MMFCESKTPMLNIIGFLPTCVFIFGIAPVKIDQFLHNTHTTVKCQITSLCLLSQKIVNRTILIIFVA